MRFGVSFGEQDSRLLEASKKAVAIFQKRGRRGRNTRLRAPKNKERTDRILFNAIKASESNFVLRATLSKEEGGGKKVKMLSRWCRSRKVEKKLRAGENFCFSRELLFFTSKTDLKPCEKSTRMEETRGKFVLHRCIWGWLFMFHSLHLWKLRKTSSSAPFFESYFFITNLERVRKYRLQRVCVRAAQNRCMRAKTFTQAVGGDRTNLVSTVSMGQVDEQLRIRLLRSFFLMVSFWKVEFLNARDVERTNFVVVIHAWKANMRSRFLLGTRNGCILRSFHALSMFSMRESRA